MNAVFGLALWGVIGFVPDQESASFGDDWQRQVRQLLDQKFREYADEAQRSAAAVTLTRELLQWRVSPVRVGIVFGSLPEAMNHHRWRLYFDHSTADAARVRLPAALRDEGFEAHIQLLARRISWAMQTELSEAGKGVVVEQINTLFDRHREVLKERLLGEAGAMYADRHVESLRQTWLNGLNEPLGGCLQTPLTESDLRSVLEGMAESARSFSPVLVTADDVRNEERLKELGIQDLLQAVRKACYGAMALGTKESGFREAEERIAAWEKRALEAVKAEVRRQYETLGPEKSLEDPEAPSGRGLSPGSSLSNPRRHDDVAARTTTAPLKDPGTVRSGDKAVTPGSSEGRTAPMITLFLVLILGGLSVWLTLRRFRLPTNRHTPHSGV